MEQQEAINLFLQKNIKWQVFIIEKQLAFCEAGNKLSDTALCLKHVRHTWSRWPYGPKSLLFNDSSGMLTLGLTYVENRIS
jgi:hypothetical protein